MTAGPEADLRARLWTIDRTWDGDPARSGEIARVELLPASGGIDVRVDAPYHGDPRPAAPPGHYLALRFHGRQACTRDDLLLRYAATQRGDRWEGRAHLPAALLPQGVTRANACAMHGQGAARRYLSAATLGGARPDFHRLERFPEIEPIASG